MHKPFLKLSNTPHNYLIKLNKAFKQINKKLRKKYETQKINGTTVTFETINSDKEESKVSEFEQEYKVQIKGFPTIYLVKGNQVIEFDTEPTENTLTEFLNTAL